MHPEQQDSPKSLDPAAVRQYLTMNPDFFNQHSDVLARLYIPHDSGGAISLIEKQVSVLRNKCNRLENSLRDLINVARENERLHQRLHRLIQDIISAESLQKMVTITRESLIANFKADDVRLFLSVPSDGTEATEKMFSREAKDNYFTLSPKDPVFDVFSKYFVDGETFCGALSDEQRALLSTGCNTELASAAVIPLQFNGQQGIVVLGSSDATRFSAGKGVMFLNQLGEVLSRRVQSFSYTDTTAAAEQSSTEETSDAKTEELADV